MYLIDAIYFKSSWNEKFDALKTHTMQFFKADNSTVQANFMDSKIDFKRFDNDEADVFELPYHNSKYSMVIVMPASGTVKQLIANLDSVKWKTWMSGLISVNSELQLPKFKFTFFTSLNNSLINLGMGAAFTKDADFSKLSTSNVQVTSVIHKAYVEVDEEGTTAAAVTVGAVGTTAVPITPPTIINRPFIFAIRQPGSGLILFAGVMNDPTVQ